MGDILEHIRQSFRETFPARASEWALASMLFLWSFALAGTPDLFERPNSPFGPLLGLMTQNQWAWLCFVAGLVRLVSLTINGAWRRTPHLRAFTAFISAGFWFYIASGIVMSGNGTTGLAIYPVLFLLDVYNVMRAVGDAGSADRIYHEALRDDPDS